MKYILPPLPFALDALEPYMDTRTVEVHYYGHHKSYVDKLNKAFKDRPDLRRPVEELLASLDTLPVEMHESVKNNAGGHANHSLLWSLLAPQAGGTPTGSFASVLHEAFGDFGNFKERFTNVAVDHFSNGWAWLATDRKGALHLLSTKDHETPITQGLTPLVVLDLWEHAYYLKHQNRRPEFVEAFWSILNWVEVGKRWDEFKQKGGTCREWRLAG